MSQNRVSRRHFLKLAGAGITGALIAACGQAPAQPTAAPAANKPAEAPKATEAPKQAPAASGGKEYTMWGLQYDPHVERYNMLADAFQKQTGAKANIQPQAWPLETKVLAAMAANTVPDVVCIMGKASVPLFVQKAVMQVDDPVFKSVGIDATKFFFPEALQAYTWQGHYYGVPLESNQVSTVVGTRYDFLDEVGDKAKSLWPSLQKKDGFESFDDLWALAEVMQKKDGSNVARWGLSGQGWDFNQFTSIMRSVGKFFWDAQNQKFTLDSDEAVQAMQLYIETPVKKGLETQLDDHHMNSLFAGKVAVGMGNTSMPGEGAKIKLKVETVTVPPANKGKPPLFVGEGGWGWEIPVRAKQPQIAVDFLKFMSTRDGQAIYSGIYGGAVPATPTVLDADYYKGDDIVQISKRRAIATLPNTVFFGNDWGLDVTGTDAPFANCRQGKMSAKDACMALQSQLTANFQKWKDSIKS